MPRSAPVCDKITTTAVRDYLKKAPIATFTLIFILFKQFCAIIKKIVIAYIHI